MTRVVSFNINGVRARPHQLEALRDRYDPDVIALQETKVQDPDFPRALIEGLGYQVAFYGQKAHYGVALLSKQAPLVVECGFPGEDELAQRRLIAATYELGGSPLTVLNGYFPQGESRDHPVKFPHKERFYAELGTLLCDRYSPDQNLLLVGDMNVAPQDLDIGIGDDNAKRWLKSGKCSFLPEEREWLAQLMDWGLADAFRICHPQVDDRFSWFDYRSKGFEREPKRGLRIDLLLASTGLQSRVRDAGIAYDVRQMDKPSDHCPVWVDLD
ncbi:MAG: exodeoxyribonuclease III [Chromatiaceae bacterium]|nr:exodeoxyribonuclease III [Gammaproteobacteria bacterium]MCP5300991.1 exodeoxyribonuclease III [Chromatiaceae bacterium]MCP5421536.1 exodeoxyribonuclease III [Chromatiaceae bacterium]